MLSCSRRGTTLDTATKSVGDLRTWTIVSTAGVIWLALVVVGAVSGKPEQFRTISDIVPVLLITTAFFERWIWRWAFLPRVVSVPVLHGTWKGELESLWRDSRTGETPQKKTVYLTVDQTMTSICVRLLSDESASDQVAGSLMRPPSGPRVLSAVYVNTPTVSRRDASPMHYGGLVLRVVGTFPVRRLEGEYWTDRQSRGALVFEGRSSKAADSFADAQTLTFD